MKRDESATGKKTLRDEFAMQAISGLALHQLDHWDKAATRAYLLADQMMIARDKEKENGDRHSDALR